VTDSDAWSDRPPVKSTRAVVTETDLSSFQVIRKAA
jgi:hypothetical protein